MFYLQVWGYYRTLPAQSTLQTGAGPLAPYTAFLGSTFRRAVLWRTLEIALATTAIALLVGFVTAYVVSRAPPGWRSVLIVLAVFPLLTGVVVRSFAWLIILGREGILNRFLVWIGVDPSRWSTRKARSLWRWSICSCR